MAIVIKPITVEVSKPNVFQAIAAKQNDCNSRFLNVTFVNEGEKIPVLTTSKVTINAKRNDGMSDSFFGEVNDDGTATLPIHSWILELAGYVDCDVTIIDSEGRALTCTKFSLLVEEASNSSSDVTESEQYNVLSDLINEVKEISNLYPKDEIAPVFANNSWEVIKKVSQYDDPSKYWKVGDYKEVGMGEFLNINSDEFTIVDKEALKQAIGFTEGTYKLFIEQLNHSTPYQDARAMQLYIMPSESKSTADYVKKDEAIYTEVYSSVNETSPPIPDNEVYACGIKYDKWCSHAVSNTYHEYSLIYDKNKTYLFQIIGFNHDKVTDPYNYGKQKAGITLQLGVSRNIYGDTEASLPIIPIDGLMTSNGYYKAPNDVKEDFSSGATNWADSGFRKALQSIFDNAEIAPYLVNVQKLTSKYYKSALYWSDTVLTEDKVFLPSEYEMFGDQILAPSKEGEQYELYADGYSKFMWAQELLDSPTGTVMRLWLRSGYGTKVNENKGDSNYSCNVYLSVNTFDPISVIYSPSYATGGNGLIAPCICL